MKGEIAFDLIISVDELPIHSFTRQSRFELEIQLEFNTAAWQLFLGARLVIEVASTHIVAMRAGKTRFKPRCGNAGNLICCLNCEHFFAFASIISAIRNLHSSLSISDLTFPIFVCQECGRKADEKLEISLVPLSQKKTEKERNVRRRGNKLSYFIITYRFAEDKRVRRVFLLSLGAGRL